MNFLKYDLSRTKQIKSFFFFLKKNLILECLRGKKEKEQFIMLTNHQSSQECPSCATMKDGESIVWDQGDEIWYGEDGESPYPLGVLHPDMPLDWTLDGDEGEDPSLAILDAIDEEFHWKTMVAHQKTKGMRELLNLKSSITYSDARAPSRRWKGKAYMM